MMSARPATVIRSACWRLPLSGRLSGVGEVVVFDVCDEVDVVFVVESLLTPPIGEHVWLVGFSINRH